MRNLTIDEFLTRLASRAPAPGGGASAGLHAAQAAALLAMVARYSDAPRLAADADQLIAAAVRLAEDDIAAFGAVAEAYKLPKDQRSEPLAKALAGAMIPPLEVLALCRRLLTLADEVLPVVNKNVITDIAAAGEAVRAAAGTSRVNVEVNARGELPPGVSDVDDLLAHVDRLTAAVRAAISS
ncbi:cyclodeaminase/cyclohydrolase family protein [Fodinicola acaciae]|uniref:cyclodeaminase/cyclohydrolase family protein n=1 Tax=Fodinicola acaciae TaxID=2681555 RepID=UPI0013D1740F|nr:cyclodeaminase/cyclohydrolase family protein [Fodinicola acaciae]